MLDLGWQIRLPGRTIADARPLVEAALKAQGFGVLTEIDVQATLRAKLGQEISPYLILGACNPKLASRALAVDPQVGLLLPCNVVVRADGDDAVVEVTSPEKMFRVAELPALKPIATEAERLLGAAVEALRHSIVA